MANASLVFELIAKDKASKDVEGLADKIDKTGDKASKLGDFFKKGLAGVAGVAAGAGAALVAGLFTSLEREASGDKLAAQLGLDEGQSKKAGEIAGRIYAGAYGESLSEVNDAVRSVVQNIGIDLNSVDLEPITGSVFDLATAFDQDLNSVTRAAGDLLRNKLAPDAKSALDIITTGFQAGADRSDDFLDTINEYSPQFAKLGIKGPQAIGLISQGLKAGARNADLIGDAFKEFSIRAVDGSESSAKAFKDLGFDVKDVTKRIAEGGPTASTATGEVIAALNNISDPLAREAAGVALFGTQFEDLGQGVFSALDPAKAALTDTAGKTNALGQTLNDNAKTNIEGFKRKAQEVFVGFIGDKVIPSIQNLIAEFKNGEGTGGKLRDAFDKIKKSFEENRPALEAFLKALADTATFVVSQGIPALVDLGSKTVTALLAIRDAGFKVQASILDLVGKTLSAFGAVFGVLAKIPGPFQANFKTASIAIDSAKGRVDALKIALDVASRPKTAKIDAKVVGTDNVNAMRRAIDQVKSKTVFLTTVLKTENARDSNAASRGTVQGKRADGGPVFGARPFLVGEREPEVFVPGRSGQILNQKQLTEALSGAGGGTTYNVTFGQADDPARIIALLKQMELLNA